MRYGLPMATPVVAVGEAEENVGLPQVRWPSFSVYGRCLMHSC